MFSAASPLSYWHWSKTYQYDQIGNLMSKSDVGTYAYGWGAAGPHALSATSNANGITTFGYDANGNLVGIRPPSPDPIMRTFTYTSANQPATITDGVVSASFLYDPDRGRIRQEETEGAQTRVTHYVGKLFERVRIAGTVREDRHYVYAGDTLIAVVVALPDLTTLTRANFRYVHGDHRHSIETITDGNGEVVERLSYDPHGKRRLADWLDPPPDVPVTGVNTTRGFTGHEHLDLFGLVHANARMYDPVLGRFLSPDPLVQAPGNSQNLNRYSYVINNPLSYFDATGNSFGGFWKKNWRVIVAVVAAVVVSVVTYGILTSPTVAAILGSAGPLVATGGALVAGGAAFGGISTGTWSGAGWGALGGFATFAGGAIGAGLYTELRGGRFLEGFLASGLTSFVGAETSGLGDGFTAALVRTTASAVAGGTASVIGGGKFENGAVTGGFQRLFAEGFAGGFGAAGDNVRSAAAAALTVAADVARKLWALPNTVIGFGAAMLGSIPTMGGTLRLRNNALEFIGNTITPTAITFGNVIIYGRSADYHPDVIRFRSGRTLGFEEMQHTFQAEALGPFYLPAHIALGAAALIRDGFWHGSTNLLEVGPHARDPRPWHW